MSGEGYLAARNPLQARLDLKAFVQLTVWVVVVLGALGAGRWAYARIAKQAGKVTGMVTQGGTPDMFQVTA